MKRILEILKMFQSNPEFVSLSYLVKKFSVTTRTLQKDLARINRLLAPIGNYKIIKSKDKLIILGNNPKVAIDKLLRKLLKVLEYNHNVKWYQLIFYQIWESQPLTNNKLFNFSESVLYNLKQEVSQINNYFNYYNLHLKLKFRTKQGWVVEGSEFDLRLLATRILISHTDTPLHPNNYLDTSLVYLQNKVATILLNHQFYNSFAKEILWFLIIVVKRIRLNRYLANESMPPMLLQFANNQFIANNFIRLAKILQKEFNVKFDHYEVAYVKSLMLLNQKNLISNDFLTKLILNINNYIINLLTKEYNLKTFAIQKIEPTLVDFLRENLVKILFNFYQDFKFEIADVETRYLNSSYWYGWEILNIIVFALKRFKINIEFRYFVGDYFLMFFNNFYLENKEKDWIVSLYYQTDNKFFHQNRKIILFVKNNYENVVSKSISNNMSNIYYKRNVLNKNYTILVDHQFNDDLLPNKKLYLINNNQTDYQLKQNFDFVLENMLIDKIRSSILIFQYFFKHKFSGIKSFLTYMQEAIVRKFKLNSVNFRLEDAFINSNFLLNKILIVHKLVTKSNIVLPIILVSLKLPLKFHKKFPIQFIFILTNNANNLYRYQGLISYLDVTKDNFSPPVKSVKNLYQIINNM